VYPAIEVLPQKTLSQLKQSQFVWVSVRILVPGGFQKPLPTPLM